MAKFLNLRRDIDKISLDILDLFDNVNRNLHGDHFVDDTFRSEVMNEMSSIQILETILKCEKSIDLMQDANRLLKLEARRRELDQLVSSFCKILLYYIKYKV